jgi:4-amino-4-deoxy-L-arabinose transferase-like glycosyltransferase
MMQTAVETTKSPSSMPKTGRKDGPHTLAISGIALVARALVIWFAVTHFPHAWLYSRGIELGTLAQSLLAGRGLSSPFGGSTGPTALLAPGYPAVIAAFFYLFGSFTFTAALAVMALQLLFNVMTVLLIMRLAERFFGVRAANLAGIFWALSLPLLWMPTIFWETCLSTLILVVMIALALCCEVSPGFLIWLSMGAFCGLAALVNPALLPALLAIFGWAAWQTRKMSRYSPVLGLLVLFLVFVPWPIRNARVLYAFIPLRSTVGFELWVGNRAGATGFLDESQFPIFNKQEYDSYVSKGEVAYMRDKSDLAKSYIRGHPQEFLQLSVVRFFRFWTGTGSKDGSIFFALHAVLTTSLGLIGIWRLVKTRRFSLAVLFALPLVLFPLPYYITHAEFRYRLVIDPILTILAAYAVSEWIARAKEHIANTVETSNVDKVVSDLQLKLQEKVPWVIELGFVEGQCCYRSPSKTSYPVSRQIAGRLI